MNMPRKPKHGRTAFAYEPKASPAAINVTTYAFGSDEESTRPDRVRRMPSAAIIIQRKGRLFECHDDGRQTSLPRIALLGPSIHACIWSTLPNTEFLMVNLAPGATRKLFDIEPGDIANQAESLGSHAMAHGLRYHASRGPGNLHRHLCRLIDKRHPDDSGVDRRSKGIFQAMRDRFIGSRVRDYADHFGVTCRTLQRLVRAEVGLSPKHVIAIERMRNLIVLTAGGWKHTAADLAQAGGFFDQSHLRYELARHGMGSVGEMVGGDHIVVRK